MGPVHHEPTPAQVTPSDSDSHASPETGHRYATVDPEEQQRWSRRLREFCSDVFAPLGTRS